MTEELTPSQGKNKMSTPKSGDLFSFPLSADETAFGRIMLNIQTQCILPKRLAPGSNLELFNNTVLVEIYRETSGGMPPASRTVLIPGLLTGYALMESGLWKVLENLPVDPMEVAFPQFLGSKSIDKAAIFEGEIDSVFEMDMAEVIDLELDPGTIGALTLGEIVLHRLGRKDEIKHPGLTDVEIRNLGRYDLRFSEHRDRIYGLAGFDPNESYYDRSKRIGFDLARFYE